MARGGRRGSGPQHRRACTSPADGPGSGKPAPTHKTARTVAIRHGETVNAPALIAMFRPVIASNRVDGWRKLVQHADSRDRVRLAAC